MSTNTPDLKAQIKSVNVIYYSFLAGLFFVGVSSALTDESSKLGHDETLSMIFLIMSASATVISIFLGIFLYKFKMKAINAQQDLTEKFIIYRTAMILRIAPMLAASFFASITFRLTGNYILIGCSALIFVVFILLRPVKEKMAQELELDAIQKSMMME